ncbi:hypothetical protein K438DRAFT_1945784 [Mycena galopus ATCC 62051]|nr:hypothetical protein K438DRAFT_1945784 [Mycena galopus ATCC 62051]
MLDLRANEEREGVTSGEAQARTQPRRDRQRKREESDSKRSERNPRRVQTVVGCMIRRQRVRRASNVVSATRTWPAALGCGAPEAGGQVDCPARVGYDVVETLPKETSLKRVPLLSLRRVGGGGRRKSRRTSGVRQGTEGGAGEQAAGSKEPRGAEEGHGVRSALGMTLEGTTQHT